jgi:hypothetical protein
MWPLSAGKITQRMISKKLSGGVSRQEIQIVCSRGDRHVWHVLYHAITNTSLNRLMIQVLWVGTPPPEIKCLWPLHWLSLCVCSSTVSYVSPYTSLFFFLLSEASKCSNCVIFAPCITYRHTWQNDCRNWSDGENFSGRAWNLKYTTRKIDRLTQNSGGKKIMATVGAVYPVQDSNSVSPKWVSLLHFSFLAFSGGLKSQRILYFFLHL